MSLRAVGSVRDTTTITLYHPSSGEVLKNADGGPMTVLLHGPYSARYKAVLREQQQRRPSSTAASRAARVSVLDPEEMESYTRELFARCIEDWAITLEGEEQLPCTPENIESVLTEFVWVRDQISMAMGDISGFLEPSKPN